MTTILEIPRNIYKRHPPGVWIISLVGVLNSIAVSLSLPFMALYLYRERDVSMAMVGVIILICGLAALVSQLVAGTIADKLGRRPLLMATMTACILLYFCMAFSIGYSAPVPLIILIWAALRSTFSMQRPAFQSMAVDLAPRERMTETFGILIIGGNLGFAVGPALGGYLADWLSFAWLFGLGAFVIGLAFVLVTLFLKESFKGSTEKVSIGAILSAGKNPQLLYFTLTCFMLYMVSGQLTSTLSVYTVSYAGFTTAQFGTLLTLNGTLITLIQYPATRLMSRFPLSSALVTGSLLYAMGYLTLTWVGPYGLALMAIAVITSGEILCTPSIMTVVGKLASTNWRGRYMAFLGMGETLGMSLGPLLGGFLLDRFAAQPIFVWGVSALLAVGAAISFGLLGRQFKNTS
ncbi:MAG TPA: MFS transporter [Dehalococcoidales bacterium]|nr:MFS transporter [Dehalococcoidales bacterium]